MLANLSIHNVLSVSVGPVNRFSKVGPGCNEFSSRSIVIRTEDGEITVTLFSSPRENEISVRSID